jgi:all-trans-retinol 13,14-reductase
VLATASALTHRDYLHSPDGSAYGIRQKSGQFNLFGRLPVRNFLAAGQSAVLPGVLGTMMTSFTICRSLVGADTFDAWLQERLHT